MRHLREFALESLKWIKSTEGKELVGEKLLSTPFSLTLRSKKSSLCMGTAHRK